jgi:hypothetical protein
MWKFINLVVLFMLGICVARAEEPLDVYIFAGQSNMAAKGSEYDKLPAELQREQKSVFVFGENRWISLAPSQDARFGPEISCAATLSEALGKPFGIVKHAKGGTSLAEKWDPDDPESLYAELKAMVDAARASRPIRVVGMFWMQGEKDSKTQAYAEAYQKNLEHFIQRTRADFRSPDMVFIAGRVNPPKSKYPFVEIVRTAQEQCVVENYNFIDCDDLPKLKDKIHYNTDGVVEMGRRFANKITERR